MRTLGIDMGGTKTTFSLYEFTREVTPLRTSTFATAGLDLETTIPAFLNGERCEAIGLAVAAPVRGRRVSLTNVSTFVDADDLEVKVHTRVTLLNDFTAIAYALPHLKSLRVLHPGRTSGGTRLLIGAGTGLGKTVVSAGAVLPSEGGHAGFSPRTADDFVLLHYWQQKMGSARLTWERVVSGGGLELWHKALHGLARPAADIVVASATDPACRQSVRSFLTAYGSAAGDFALDVLAPGGVFVAGGILPKVLDVLGESAQADFVAGFLDKEPMTEILYNTHVSAILDADAGALGAAAAARSAGRK